MKLLHVVHGYPPSIGGVQWLVKNLSERMISRHGDQVTVFTTTAYNMEHFWRTDEAALPAGIEEIGGVTVHRFPVYNRFGTLRMLAAHGAHRLHLPYNDWLRTIYNGPLVRGMTRAVTDSNADVVFASAFPHLHMYYALSGARRANIPVVYLGAIHVADEFGYHRGMMYRAILRADAYIALTTHERDHLIEWGIPAQRIAVIGAGVNAAAFSAANGSAVRQRYGLGDTCVVALVAKQSPRKRIDILLEAMRRVWPVVPDAHLLIAGARTAYSDRLCHLIDGLPSEQRACITVVDDFPEGEKPALLAACDLLVLPSGHESFGIAFLEAWACGKAVVGARIGAIPSVIDEGRDGLLAEFEDPDDLARVILELLTDPQRRKQMGETGRHKVLHNFTWEIVTDRVRDVYTKVLARHHQLAGNDTI